MMKIQWGIKKRPGRYKKDACKNVEQAQKIGTRREKEGSPPSKWDYKDLSSHNKWENLTTCSL